MPYRQRGSYGRKRNSLGSIVNSMKNVNIISGGLTGTKVNSTLVIAKETSVNANQDEVDRGCLIKAIYIFLDVCGLGGTGVLNNFQAYLMKNPGANLTGPTPGTEGSSNEKKFIFKTWAGMIMRNQDGNAPLHWEGWVKIPKRYQRFGQDDTLILSKVVTSGLTGHFFIKYIFKWYK